MKRTGDTEKRKTREGIPGKILFGVVGRLFGSVWGIPSASA